METNLNLGRKRIKKRKRILSSSSWLRRCNTPSTRNKRKSHCQRSKTSKSSPEKPKTCSLETLSLSQSSSKLSWFQREQLNTAFSSWWVTSWRATTTSSSKTIKPSTSTSSTSRLWYSSLKTWEKSMSRLKRNKRIKDKRARRKTRKKQTQTKKHPTTRKLKKNWSKFVS